MYVAQWLYSKIKLNKLTLGKYTIICITTKNYWTKYVVIIEDVNLSLEYCKIIQNVQRVSKTRFNINNMYNFF